MARDIIIATFGSRDRAYEAAREIDALDHSVIDVKGGAIVEKDVLGNVVQLDSKGLDDAWGTVAGVAGGTLVGALIGAVAGPAGAVAAAAGASAAAGGLVGGAMGATSDLVDLGVKEDYIALVSSRLLPGDVAIVAEADEYSTTAVDEAVWRHGGLIFRNVIGTPVL